MDKPSDQKPRPDSPFDEGDDAVDESGKESFPTSDPPSSWAGADRG